jgi:ADP-ribose pyrophosphatase YjhB (NUDIX family)
MKYCSECGAKVVFEQHARGATWRFVCKACGAVFYQSPKLATACIADWQGRILLCRRAVDPERGRWELPAGFVAAGETVSAGAVREALEEANVEVEIERPYALLHVPHVNQMRVVYLARLRSTQFKAGAETLEVRLFEEDEIPWDLLAFATTRDTLRRYFADRKDGVFGFFFAEIVPVHH